MRRGQVSFATALVLSGIVVGFLGSVSIFSADVRVLRNDFDAFRSAQTEQMRDLQARVARQSCLTLQLVAGKDKASVSQECSDARLLSDAGEQDFFGIATRRSHDRRERSAQSQKLGRCGRDRACGRGTARSAFVDDGQRLVYGLTG